MANHVLRIFRAVPHGMWQHAARSSMLGPLLLVAMTSTAAAALTPAQEGKAISGMCAACHGENGIAVDTRYPNLTGQNYQYLVHALESFKDGQRPNDIMHSMTVNLSKTRIKDLAAYYSSIHSVAGKKR